MGVLGQEPVTRVNRLGARDLGGAQHVRNVAVAEGILGGTDADVLIRGPHMHRVRIHVGMDRDRPDTELLAGSDDPEGNLPTIPDQNLLEHRLTPASGSDDQGAGAGSIRNNGWPNSTGLVLSARILTMRASTSDSMSFISLIDSSTHKTCPFWTASPASPDGSVAGRGDRSTGP